LWPEPEAALLDWRNRYNATLADIDDQLAATRSPDATLPSATRARLLHLRQGYDRYKGELRDLLAPLNVGQALARETHLALRTRLPSHHGVLSYAQNIFRDWSWGNDENKQVASHFAAMLDDLQPGAKMLVLGAGAGRLAFDLHHAMHFDNTWALDSNPLLCLIGARMTTGATANLTEFPLAPISTKDCAVARTLAAPTPTSASSNLQFVCADALHPPFAPEQFDVVITPWLLDVIDATAPRVMRVIARLLRRGGIWVSHGSVAFAGADPANRLAASEIAELAQQHGFEVTSTTDTMLPYLQSPSSRQRREELVYTQVARRDERASRAPMSDDGFVPQWIIDERLAVPLTTAFETQISTLRIHAFIMSLIDGERSVLDMARVFEEQRLMPASEAVQAIRGFLTTMHEEAVTAQGRSIRDA
jgi:SAM-dependent methyltransferase